MGRRRPVGQDATAFNQPIGDWQVDQVTNMRFMFAGAAAFDQPLGEWKVDQGTKMNQMFAGAAMASKPSWYRG